MNKCRGLGMVSIFEKEKSFVWVKDFSFFKNSNFLKEKKRIMDMKKGCGEESRILFYFMNALSCFAMLEAKTKSLSSLQSERRITLLLPSHSFSPL